MSQGAKASRKRSSMLLIVLTFPSVGCKRSNHNAACTCGAIPTPQPRIAPCGGNEPSGIMRSWKPTRCRAKQYDGRP